MNGSARIKTHRVFSLRRTSSGRWCVLSEVMALGSPTITVLEVDTTCPTVPSDLSYLTGPGHGWEDLVLQVQEALGDKIQEELRAPLAASRGGGFRAGPSGDRVGAQGPGVQGRPVWGKGTRSFLPRWLLLECEGLSQQKYISVLSLKLQGQDEAGGKWR